MQRREQKFLEDIRIATDHVRTYAKGKTFTEFEQDNLLRDAIYMNFIVIGESLTALRKISPAIAESLTDWSKIIGFRNQITHGYAQLKHQITWLIIQNELPVLHAEVARLIDGN